MSGKKSPQYEAVQKNWAMLVGYLEVGKALSDLRREVRSKGWIAATATPHADGLVQVALNRIENKVGNYKVFIGMLKRVTGMDEAVRIITNMCALSPPEGVEGAAYPGGSQTDGPSHMMDMMCYTDWMILPDQHTGEAELWYEREVELWKKKELKVEFLNMDDIPTFRKEDGDPFSSESVLKIANEWHGAGIEQGCDVVPKFIRYKGDQTGSDIRVTFIVSPEEEGNSRSKVGTIAERYRGETTMWLHLTPKRYKRTIRHEFGHALGMKHEHQSEGAPDQYDEEKLKNYLLKRMFRNKPPPINEHEKRKRKKKVEDKIKSQWAKITAPTGRHSNYDQDSVMHYLIPEEVRDATYGGPTVEPEELSESDKKYIVEFYSDIQDEVEEADTGVIDNASITPGGQVPLGKPMAQPNMSTTGRTGKLDINRDPLTARRLLYNLRIGQLNALFRELGLYDGTLLNGGADDWIRAWILGDDGVTTSGDYPGGATWENLRKALNACGHVGIAKNI